VLLEVGVDLGGGARGGRAAADRPGADLLRAGGEVGDQVEERVGGADQAVETGLVDPEAREELALLLRRQLGELGLDLPADADDPGALGRGIGLELGAVGVPAREGVLVDVRDVEDGLRGQQMSVVEGRAEQVRDLEGPGRQALREMLPQGVEELDLLLGGLVARAGDLARPVRPLLDRVEIGQTELDLDRLDVAPRVRTPRRRG
jgi:hypothetical protein